MSKKAQSSLWIVRVARGHRRLAMAAVLGVAVYLLLPGSWAVVTRLLAAWDAGVAFYLVLAAVMMARSPIAEIRKHSALQDEGAFALMVLALAASAASLVAIFFELAGGRDAALGAGPYVLAIATVLLSWTFTHTIFALHYAYEFYGEGQRANGLKFPGDSRPDYWDFMYFSFVVGTTFQVSDVAITNRWIRHSVSIHGVLSFFFNTTVLALTVNMAANAI
jgi:uncharacterized membrane protein